MKRVMYSTLMLFTLLFASFFFAAPEIYAQDFQLYSERDIIVETIPEIPGPNEEVSLKLNSYSFNLNNYYIAWFENGEQRSAGYGAREFQFMTGSTGDASSITAVIEVGNQVFRKELRFSPSMVDLLWEVSDAYTPPFYQGKALPLPQSTLKITAIPETQLIAPTDAPNLIYYWDRNYRRDVTASGFGRQSFTIKSDPLLKEERISVTTNDRRENSFAKNSIEIPTKVHDAKILFYQEGENGRTMTNKALNSNASINGDTVKMSFHPLHISTTKENFTDLFVQWNLNGEDRSPQNFARQHELYISSGGQSGSVPISVSLSGVDNLLQEYSENIRIFFNQ